MKPEKRKLIRYKDVNFSEIYEVQQRKRKENRKYRFFMLIFKTIILLVLLPILVVMAMMSIMATDNGSPQGIKFFYFMSSFPVILVIYLVISWFAHFMKK